MKINLSPKSFSALPRHSVRLFASSLLLSFYLVLPFWAVGGQYIDPQKVNGIALLAPPPTVGSEEHNADFACARAVFKARTHKEEARANAHAKLSVFNFTPAIGSWFKPGKLPKTEAFFQNIRPDIRASIALPKEHWKRKRPYELDSSLELGKPEPSASYPSGHSTTGTVQALLLAELFPDRREAILAIGREIGWDRVLIGKHFPTDIHAGRVLAQAIVREMMASPTFQQQFAEVKRELEILKDAQAATK